LLVLLLDEDGSTCATAPPQPSRAYQGIDGLCIGEADHAAPPCTAGNLLSSLISQDPLWEPYRGVAEPMISRLLVHSHTAHLAMLWLVCNVLPRTAQSEPGWTRALKWPPTSAHSIEASWRVKSANDASGQANLAT